MRTRTDRERSTFFSRLTVAIVAVGLIYVGSSVAVMFHLVQENNQTCLSRQEARESARQYLIFIDDDFTEKDKALLDELFPMLEC